MLLYAIGMLEMLDKRKLISPLLLHHESPRVRARVLRSLSAVRSHIALRWRPAVERLVHDPDVGVRAAALRALAEFSHEDAASLLRRHLNDPEPQVAVTAAMMLAQSGLPGDIDAAERTFQRLIADSREGGVIGRREAAVALAYIGAHDSGRCWFRSSTTTTPASWPPPSTAPGESGPPTASSSLR